MSETSQHSPVMTTRDSFSVSISSSDPENVLRISGRTDGENTYDTAPPDHDLLALCHKLSGLTTVANAVLSVFSYYYWNILSGFSDSPFLPCTGHEKQIIFCILLLISSQRLRYIFSRDFPLFFCTFLWLARGKTIKLNLKGCDAAVFPAITADTLAENFLQIPS